jgi:hypothetical protein
MKKYIKTFEGFLGKKEIENLEKPNYIEVDRTTRDNILNVDNFNKWLSEDYTGYGGSKGAPGIIGRIDKLSKSIITDYFTDCGVECTERETYDFMDVIRSEWLKR